MKSTITVVICTFNRSHLIKRTIDSVYNTGVDEILVVNEGSNDEHSQKVVELLKSYPKIKYIYDSINNGFSHSKNTGCKAATSEWVMFLDDDDYFIKNPVAFWKSTMNQHPEADIIHHSIKDIQLNKSVQYWGASAFTLEDIKEHNRIPGSSLFKRAVWESLDGFRSIPYEDWDFWLRATFAGYKVKVIPEYLFFYRFHGVSGNVTAISNHEKNLKYMLSRLDII